MYFPQPTQPDSNQVPADLRWLLLRNSGAADLLLYSAQGAPRCGRYASVNTIMSKLLTLSAYTIYSFFEWSLVLLDVAFDAVTMIEFKDFEIVVKDNRGISRGYVSRLPS